MIVRVCDNCQDTVPDDPTAFVQLGLSIEGRWMVLDLCGTDCVLNALSIAFPEREQEEDEREYETDFRPSEEAEPADEEDDEEEPARLVVRRSPDESTANEKLFKKAAAKMTEDITGVTQRGLRS